MFMQKQLRYKVRMIIENIQQADKVYFKTGKLSPKVREIIIDRITGGDNYTKIITDIYYAMLQQDLKLGDWAISHISDEEFKEKEHYETENDVMKLEDLKKVKNYYNQLKNYDKNVFPIKDLNINEVKDVWELIRSLNEREKIIKEIEKMPSIAIRNLKNDIRTQRNSKELQEIRSIIEYIYDD